MSNGHWLVGDWDSRNPSSDLKDIDCGKYMNAIQQLPNNIRLMLQDAEMHCEVDEIQGVPVVTKIIKKRDAAYLQSSEHFFIYDEEGRRIPLTEEEFHALLGLKEDPEDVLNMEGVDLQSIDSEHVAPLDVYDVVYDSTEYMRTVARLLESDKFQQKSITEKQEIINKLQDELIYSADFFPYPQDKRLHSKSAQEVAKTIIEQDLTKQQLGAILGPRNPEKRMEYVVELRKKASRMLPGKGKANLLLKAQKVFDSLNRDRKAGKTKEESIFTDTDRAKLWAIWRAKEARNKGEVKLLPWQFQKLYGAKLLKKVLMPELESIDNLFNEGRITREEAKTLRGNCKALVDGLLTERMETLFKTKKVKPVEIERGKAPILAIDMPSWLAEAPPISDEDIPMDCLTEIVPPEPEEVLDIFDELQEFNQQELITETLLEGGAE